MVGVRDCKIFTIRYRYKTRMYIRTDMDDGYLSKEYTFVPGVDHEGCSTYRIVATSERMARAMLCDHYYLHDPTIHDVRDWEIVDVKEENIDAICIPMSY